MVHLQPSQVSAGAGLPAAAGNLLQLGCCFNTCFSPALKALVTASTFL
jgi:hypothetical protein